MFFPFLLVSVHSFGCSLFNLLRLNLASFFFSDPVFCCLRTWVSSLSPGLILWWSFLPCHFPLSLAQTRVCPLPVLGLSCAFSPFCSFPFFHDWAFEAWSYSPIRCFLWYLYLPLLPLPSSGLKYLVFNIFLEFPPLCLWFGPTSFLGLLRSSCFFSLLFFLPYCCFLLGSLLLLSSLSPF